MMRPVTNLELAFAALAVAVVILVFAGMRFVVDEPGKEPLVYFIAFLVIIGLSASFPLLRKRRRDGLTSPWSRPVSDATANAVVNIVSFLWFCLVTLIVFLMLRVKANPMLIVALSLALIAVIIGGRYLRRRVFHGTPLLPYAVASVGALTSFLMIAAFV